MLVREVAQIAETGFGIVQGQRIQRGDLHASDARRLHLFEFLLDLRLGDRRAEPPPAHHDAAVIRRMRERICQAGQI